MKLVDIYYGKTDMEQGSQNANSDYPLETVQNQRPSRFRRHYVLRFHLYYTIRDQARASLLVSGAVSIMSDGAVLNSSTALITCS